MTNHRMLFPAAAAACACAPLPSVASADGESFIGAEIASGAPVLVRVFTQDCAASGVQESALQALLAKTGGGAAIPAATLIASRGGVERMRLGAGAGRDDVARLLMTLA